MESAGYAVDSFDSARTRGLDQCGGPRPADVEEPRRRMVGELGMDGPICEGEVALGRLASVLDRDDVVGLVPVGRQALRK